MKDPRKLADEFVAQVSSVLGERLRAATLFGSVARDEWIEGVSDVNVLILLDDIDAPVLARAAPAVNAAVGRGVQPLLMELEEWRRAADVFTIELADMRDASITLAGDDPVADVHVDTGMLRLQAERELRAKLLHLHAGMVVAAGDRKRLGDLFIHAVPSFVTYFRAALRLANRPVPQASREVVEQGCDVAGADPAAILRVLDARTSGEKLELTLDAGIADEFNTAAQTLAAHIDAFGR
jgi:predicted nucleotidyltransferase